MVSGPSKSNNKKFIKAVKDTHVLRKYHKQFQLFEKTHIQHIRNKKNYESRILNIKLNFMSTRHEFQML